MSPYSEMVQNGHIRDQTEAHGSGLRARRTGEDHGLAEGCGCRHG